MAHITLKALLTLAFTGVALCSWLSFPVTGRDDSAEERLSDGSVDLTSSDLEMCHEYDSSSPPQVVVIVFPVVNLSATSNLIGTRLVFDVDEIASDQPQTALPVSVRIYGEKSVSAAKPSSTTNDVSTRTKTTAFVDWSPAEHTQKHVLVYTPEVSSIVSEIVNQNGWTSGNPMAFLFEYVSGTGTRIYEKYEDNSGVNENVPYGQLTCGQNVTPALEVRPPDATPGCEPATTTQVASTTTQGLITNNSPIKSMMTLVVAVCLSVLI
jgi:hypothetical protein